MSSSLAPAWNSAIFNTNAFNSGQFLTKSEADRYYLSIFSGRNLDLIDGITPGLVSSSKAVIVDISNNISGFGNVGISGNLTLGSVSTTKTFTLNTNDVSGSTGITIINNGSVNLQTQMSSTTAYFGTYSSHNLNIMTANTSKILISTLGNVTINSTTQSTAYTNGSLILNGGLGIAKKIMCNDSIDCSFLDVNGNGIYLQNSGKTAFISILNTPSTNDLTLQSQTKSGGNNYAVLNLSYDGMIFQRSNTGSVTSSASCCLDFGSTNAADCMINFFGNGYFLGANNNAMINCSSGTNGHFFGVGSGSALTQYTAQITPQGSIQAAASLRAIGFNTSGFAGWSGPGIEIHYSSYGQIYSYNRSTLLYKGLYLSNEIYLDGSGHTSIGLGPVASSWKLEVGSNTQSISSYGYLNSGGSVGTSGSSGSVSFSAYFQGRICVSGEIDVLSDVRCKKQIRDITNEEAEKFIHKCIPKHYIFKPESNNEAQYGYIAQDIAKQGLDTLIICRETKDGLHELIDDSGFISPANTEFTVSYMKIPALLHKYILMLEERIEILEKK